MTIKTKKIIKKIISSFQKKYIPGKYKVLNKKRVLWDRYMWASYQSIMNLSHENSKKYPCFNSLMSSNFRYDNIIYFPEYDKITCSEFGTFGVHCLYGLFYSSYMRKIIVNLIDTITDKNKTNMLCMTYNISTDEWGHQNTVLFFYNEKSNKIYIFNYEPHGSEIDNETKSYSQKFVNIFKNYNNNLFEIIEPIKNTGLQARSSDSTGFCVMFCYFWCYIVTEVYNEVENIKIKDILEIEKNIINVIGNYADKITNIIYSFTLFLITEYSKKYIPNKSILLPEIKKIILVYST